VSEELANQGRIVIVAALDSTFERKPFENIISLVPLAETLQKLSAVCVFCYKEASFTLRTTPSKQIELIGG
jgi:thymidine kinase